MKTKKCPKCGTEKSLDDFPTDNTRKDGKRCYCKSCVAIRSKKYREDNPEVIRARKKKYTDSLISFGEEEKELLLLIMTETHKMAIMNNTDGLETYESIINKLEK